MSTHRQRPQSSVNRQRSRTWTVRRQSAAVINPRPRTGHARDLSATVDRQRIIRVVASRCPSCRRSISRFTSKLFQPMSSFDPATVRQAVAEFTPLRPQKFQDLIPAKDVIIELRQRRASYRAIADFAHATLSADEQDGHRHFLPSDSWRNCPATPPPRTKTPGVSCRAKWPNGFTGSIRARGNPSVARTTGRLQWQRNSANPQPWATHRTSADTQT